MKCELIGKKVKWMGTESKYNDLEWLRKGDIGVITEYHPAIEGTGKWLNDYEMYDEGLPEWWIIDFGTAGTRALDKLTRKEVCFLQPGQ
jgi:hypothetical protein